MGITAEVAEIPFTVFASAKASQQVPGRLVVRRIPDLNPPADPAQASLFAVWRWHAFFTTAPEEQMDTVAADKTHRGHAIIEQVFADLKGSALAHLPSGKFNANAAWLVLAVIAFNLTRAVGTIAGGAHTRATTATIRRRIINIPARISTSARRITIHLATAWPWQEPWQSIFDATLGPPAVATICPAADPGPNQTPRGTPGSTVTQKTATPPTAPEPATTIRAATRHPSVHSGLVPSHERRHQREFEWRK